MENNLKRGAIAHENWWEHASGVMRFYPKARGETLKDILDHLELVKEWGFDGIEVFAPYYGGMEYSGLDVMDYYQVDPAIGTMEDFLALVKACHANDLAIIAFVNLGYGAMDFPVFLKACDDLRLGVDSPEVHWFLWSDTGRETLDKSLAPHFMNDVHGGWHYSERAGKYYWVKWRGVHNDVDLPQFNFGEPILRAEIEKAVEFWMGTGVDGMIIDAVNWYIHCNWQINNQTMTDVVRRYPNQYLQPEGAGGFNDDPVLWITEGHYNSVQDYGLSIWWADRYVLGNAILSGDPAGIEEALGAYRDRVVAAGGVTYIGPRWGTDMKRDAGLGNAQKLLEMACIATIGELVHGDQVLLTLEWPEQDLHELKRILRTLQNTTALQAAGGRQKLPTNDDHKFYALLRTSKDGSQKALVVLNFQAEAQEVTVRLSEPAKLTPILTPGDEALTGEVVAEVQVQLPAYGYAVYELLS